MEKYVVVVKDGMYLGGLQTDDVFLKVKVEYYDTQSKALRVPYDAFIESSDVRDQVIEIAEIAQGELMIITISENAKTLNGKTINLKSVRDELDEDEDEDEEEYSFDFNDFIDSLFES